MDRVRQAAAGGNAAALAPLALTLLMAASGCERRTVAAPASEPPVVTVSQPIEREVTDFVDYTGRIEPVNSVDLRARVTGYLTQMPFKEGDEVKKGELLFLIDPRPYEASVAQAEATVETNQALLRRAHADNERAKILARTRNAITQQDLDMYEASEEQALANLKNSQANLRIQKLNLEWCRVLSPIDGQVSRYYLTVGNLVVQDQTVLTSIVSLDPVYVYFDMDERTVLDVRRAINEGKIKTRFREEGWIPLFLGLPGERGFPHEGKLTFINNRVDALTGTLTVRGVFESPRPPNGVRLLTAGLFVRVRLPIGQPHKAVLLSERALGTDQGLKFVYVVNSQNQVEYRRVKVGPLEPDGSRVIADGISTSDWVVMNGLQLVRPNMVVSPERMSMAEAISSDGAEPDQMPTGGGSPAATKPATTAPDAAPTPAPEPATAPAAEPADDVPPARPAAPRSQPKRPATKSSAAQRPAGDGQ